MKKNLDLLDANISFSENIRFINMYMSDILYTYANCWYTVSIGDLILSAARNQPSLIWDLLHLRLHKQVTKRVTLCI